MNKAVIMCNNNPELINRVYTLDIINQLKDKVELLDVIINHQNINQYENLLKDTEIIFSTWGMPSFSEKDIDRLFPKLKVVFYAAGTVKGFAEPFLNKGIKVFSAWHANAIPTAEFAANTIVLANKGFFQAQMIVKNKRYREAGQFTGQFPGNYKIKIGLLGAGMVGKNVIRLLKGMQINADILVFDPFLSEEKAKELGVIKADLETIFSTCQTISNHLANVLETQNMLNRTYFNLMKPYATFINTGRGQQVVEEDLIQALKDVPTRTAVLDVTFPEPPVETSELYTLDNVILTPHMAGSSGQEVERMAQFMVEELIRYQLGENLQYEVTPNMLKTMA